MAQISIAGDTSGSVSLVAPAVSGTTTLTLPTTSGTVITTGSTFGGTGPAFRAIASASQTLTNNTWTKAMLGTEAWDTNNNFNNSTYRFTPTVAGYYQINGGYSFGPTASAGYTLIASIWKNNSETIRGSEMYSLTATFNQSHVSGVLYMNGSTDYIELYILVIGGGVSTGSTDLSFMDATLVRSA
jgi:hypothetical protein